MFARYLMAAVLAMFACAGLGCSCDSPPEISGASKLATDLPDDRFFVVRFDATTSVEKSFLLYNQGTTPLVLKSASITGDTTPSFAFVESPAFPLVLAPGKDKGLSFKVKHTPASLANQIARIAFVHEPEGAGITSTLYVELQTRIQRGNLRFLCGVLTFVQVRYGQQRTQSCLLTNIGEQRVSISAILFDGKSSAAREFRLKDVTFPLVLAPGEEHSLFVTYAPQDNEEIEDTGRFVIESDVLLEPGEPKPSFEVRGTTLHKTPDIPCLKAVPDKLDFDFVEDACQVKEKTIQLVRTSATGCRDVKIEKVSLEAGSSSAFTIIKSPIGFLSDGESTAITVRYRHHGLVSDRAVLVVETSQGEKGRLIIPLFGAGGKRVEQIDTFRQSKQPQEDILIVVSNAPSMKDEQASLIQNFQAFISQHVRRNVDYHLMVISTDVSGKDGPAGCARGQVKIINKTTPNPVQTFLANTRVGTGGSAKGQGLEAVHQALSPKMLNDPKCNKDFLRKDASLSVIFVSDRDDQSPLTVDQYVNFFKGLKGIRHLDLIRVSIVGGIHSTGCHYEGHGSATSTPRYLEVSRQLKGAHDSICQSNWGYWLYSLPSITFGYRTQFFLSQQAAPETIVVKSNGQLIQEDPQDGWQYDVTNNTVNFSKSAIPAPGALIEVKYKVFCASALR